MVVLREIQTPRCRACFLRSSRRVALIANGAARFIQHIELQFTKEMLEYGSMPMEGRDYKSIQSGLQNGSSHALLWPNFKRKVRLSRGKVQACLILRGHVNSS